MHIFYVSSECAPFAASGGLGDVMGALPEAILSSGEAARVSVALPLYKSVWQRFSSELSHVSDISFKLSWRSTGASIYKTEKNGVCYYFFENHYYFDRDKLYGEHDDAERFAFFSRAVTEFIAKMETPPDVLHANDWQTALSIVYLKTEYRAELPDLKTLFTIHNIEYQGKFAPYILGDVFGISEEHRGLMEYDGCINLIKAALISSDYINTVSPNYANELKHDFFAFGLSSVIDSVSYKMSGVINGIDYDYFSPERGGEIYKSYTKRTLVSGKRANKIALLEELSLSTDESIPLIVMITRLAAGKGIDLLLHILDELLEEKVQLVILGTGAPDYEAALAEAEKRHKNLRILLKFDRVISKKMYAAADMFLMPSKSEPCGLAQMIACSYGTVPIVRSVGGLYDSIIPYGKENANGFRFDSYNAHELLFTIKEAISLYSDDDAWGALRKSAKASDFSWGKSAKEYISIYKNITKR